MISKLMSDCARGLPFTEAELRIRNAEGLFIWCHIRATTQFADDGSPVKVVGVIIDISATKLEHQKLLDMAQRDALTGLYNKAAIKAHVELHLNTPSINGLPRVLFIIDIDDFKQVNDVYGHLCGDALLADVANALKSQFRTSDIVGRIGGDEFLVFLPEIASLSAAKVKAYELLEQLANIHSTKNVPPVTCSIGATLVPNVGGRLSLAVSRGRPSALCQKNKGKNGVSFFQCPHRWG